MESVVHSISDQIDVEAVSVLGSSSGTRNRFISYIGVVWVGLEFNTINAM